MSYEFYKFLHLVGIFLLMTGLMGVYFTVWSGSSFQGSVKKFSFAMHGLGLLIVLVSGFGLLARLGLTSGLPTWVFVKLGVWAFFAIAISLLKRKGQIGWPLYALLLLGYGLAAYMAVYKP